MARNRNVPSTSLKDLHSNSKLKGPKTTQAKSKRRPARESGQVGRVLLFVFGIPLLLIGVYGYWTYRRASRLITPLYTPPVINTSELNANRFWGTYRSNLYFGLRGAVIIQSFSILGLLVSSFSRLIYLLVTKLRTKPSNKNYEKCSALKEDIHTVCGSMSTISSKD